MTSADFQTHVCRSGRWPDLARRAVNISNAGTARPSFGVVMPAYNAQSTIVQSAGSVLANFAGKDHLVIVENGSTDATWSTVVEAFSDDSRVVLDRLPTGDAAAARNRAISLLSGHDYVAFCDADDCWLPARLKVLRAIASETGAQLLFHPASTGSGRREGAFLAEKRLPRHRDFLCELLMSGNILATSTVALRTSVIPTPLFADGLRATQDFEAWCRFASVHRHPIIAYIEEPLSEYRVHMGGLSGGAWRRQANVYNTIRAYASALDWPMRQLCVAKGALRLIRHALRLGKIASLPAVVFANPDPHLFRGPASECRT